MRSKPGEKQFKKLVFWIFQAILANQAENRFFLKNFLNEEFSNLTTEVMIKNNKEQLIGALRCLSIPRFPILPLGGHHRIPE